MPKASPKTVLFLCTGNYYRSRFAEILFNSVAAKLQLSWRATSRGLALERGASNVGPMAKAAVKALQAKSIRSPDDISRFPLAIAADDFETAHWIVALKDLEHRPLLQERFPDWIERIEFWQVDDAPEALSEIEREVADLAARLITGGRPRTAPAAPAMLEDRPANDPPPGKAPTAKVGRETAGRRGKAVTTIAVSAAESELQELAGLLKRRCGTGGTVKDGRIEIQGDQRERIVGELQRLGYQVKRG